MKQTSRQEVTRRVRGTSWQSPEVVQLRQGTLLPLLLLAGLTNAWHLIWQIYIRGSALRPRGAFCFQLFPAAAGASRRRCHYVQWLKAVAVEWRGRGCDSVPAKLYNGGDKVLSSTKNLLAYVFTGASLSCLYFLCLIKTGNALKLLKKYLGSISRSPRAEGKSFPAGTAGVRLEGKVYLARLLCRLKINYKSAWLMIVNRLTLPALSLLVPFPTFILVSFIVDVLVKLCDICQVPINIRNYIFTDLRRHLCINECTFWSRYCLNLLNSSVIIELSQLEYTWILARNTLINCPTLPLTILPLTKRF